MTTATDPDPFWDLVVVGGGTAGLVGAKAAASFGARVLLVEADRLGGECLWTGCVPSKALLAAAAAAAGARNAGRLGVRVSSVEVDFAAVMRRVHEAMATIAPADSAEALQAAGVSVLSGYAVFAGPDTVTVDGVTVRFRQALLATGSMPTMPTMPTVPGLDDADALTSDTVWDLTTRPDRLTVLGGGSIGCELGQAFARLGSTVTVVEAGDRLLPGEDPTAAALVEQALVADGVDVVTGTSAAMVQPDDTDSTAGVLDLTDGRRVVYDRLLVAVGRRPRTSKLRLDRAGVDVDAHGVVGVDEHLRTTNPRIWAAGDITGHAQLTHLAGVHATLAVTNALLGLRRSVEGEVVPRVTFTHPEVAAVGVRTDRAEVGMRVLTWDHADVDRAVADADVVGFSRLVVDRRGRVVGATLVGPRAGESLAEVVLAVRHRLRTRDLAGSTHAYPTYGDGAWNAAIADVRAGLRRPAAARAVGAASGMRRAWLGARDRLGR